MTNSAQASPRPEVSALSYSINGAIKVTGFSRTRLYEFINAGLLTTFKVGSRTYIAHKALADLVDSLQHPQVQPDDAA